MTNEPRRPNSADGLYGSQWLLNPADRFPVAPMPGADSLIHPWVLASGGLGPVAAGAPCDLLWRRLVNDRRTPTSPE